MLTQIEGSRAIAETVALCHPDVVCAYPITPQTHIVEQLAAIGGSTFVNVESESSALSVALGAAVTGARAYTATSSQGLLHMAEVLYNVAGLGVPLVLTLAMRAIGAPLNIWNDHSDAMALRDAGWVQLFASSAQEAADLHILAFALAEAMAVPVMVCVDGFLLTHACERIDVPERGVVDGFLAGSRPRAMLDLEAPMTVGALVGPEAFTEVRVRAHESFLRVLAMGETLGAMLSSDLQRPVGGLVRPYRLEDADIAVVALGSINGTIAEVVDAMREEGVKVGALDIGMFRPFPRPEVAIALANARQVIVVEKNLALAEGGVLANDVRLALAARRVEVDTVIAGLGGRPITSSSIRRLVEAAHADSLAELTILDHRTAP